MNRIALARTSKVAFLALFSAFSAWGTVAAPALASPDETTRHSIPGREVAIYNLVGSVAVVRGEGADVVAEVTLKGRDADRLSIQKGRIRNRETLRVVYPGDRVVVPEFGGHTTSTIRVNDDGTFGEDRYGSRKVVLSGKGPGVEAAADIRLLVPAGKKLHVIWGHGQGKVTGIRGEVSVDAASMPLNVAGVHGLLSVDLGSGNVRVEETEAGVAIDTGSGAVELAQVRGGNVAVDTGSGVVLADDLIAENLAIDTGSGRIGLKGVRAGTVALDTGSGDVALELQGEIKNLVIESGSGNVDVLIPRGTGAQLAVETGSGRIETNLVMETQARKSDAIVGRVGDGRASIRIETGSGSVRLNEAKER